MWACCASQVQMFCSSSWVNKDSPWEYFLSRASSILTYYSSANTVWGHGWCFTITQGWIVDLLHVYRKLSYIPEVQFLGFYFFNLMNYSQSMTPSGLRVIAKMEAYGYWYITVTMQLHSNDALVQMLCHYWPYSTVWIASCTKAFQLKVFHLFLKS